MIFVKLLTNWNIYTHTKVGKAKKRQVFFFFVFFLHMVYNSFMGFIIDYVTKHHHSLVKYSKDVYAIVYVPLEISKIMLIA